MSFSEEDIFFLQNWGTIEKLNYSLQNFKRAFSKFLFSIEDILVKKDWWVKEMVFDNPDEVQICISRENWRLNDKYCIWIGVEGFKPENIFGSGTSANCYLWVTGEKKDKIKDDLSPMFENKDEFKDYLTYGGGYILKKPVRKYTEEEHKDFISGSCLQEIVAFIEKVYMVIKDYGLH